MNNIISYTFSPFLRFWGEAETAALISAAGAGASAGIMQAGQHPSKARRYAKELALYNQDLSEKMYNKYASPYAQMRQYNQAGLNPNLIYGSASPGSPQAGEVQPSVPYGENYNAMAGAISGAINEYYNVKSKQSSISNQEASTLALQTKSMLDGLKAEGQKIENEFNSVRNQYTLAGLNYDNQMKAIDLDIKNRYAAIEAKAKYENLLEQGNLSRAEQKEIEKRIEKYDQDIKESEARVKFGQQQIALGYGQLNLATQQFGEQQNQNRMNNYFRGRELALNNQNLNLKQQQFAFDRQYKIVDQYLGQVTPSGVIGDVNKGLRSKKRSARSVFQYYNPKR